MNTPEKLALPENQRQLIHFLSQRKSADLKTILNHHTNISVLSIKETLQALQAQDLVRELLIDDVVYYRVAATEIDRQLRSSSLNKVWARLKPDSLDFLQQTPLFASLSEEQLLLILQKMKKKTYKRHEVIVWQGEQSEALYLIKSGIVSISRFSSKAKEPEILAFLSEGHALGDVGILENQSRSATATALTEVETLEMQRQDFLDLLYDYPASGTQLARMLGNLLVTRSKQQIPGSKAGRIVVLLPTEPGVGSTTFGLNFAATLAQNSAYATVYTEHPQTNLLATQLALDPKTTLYPHQDGFDIYLPEPNLNLPNSVQSTLLIDHLFNEYTNIIINATEGLHRNIGYILEWASQVLLITSPQAKSAHNLNDVHNALLNLLPSQPPQVYRVLNHPEENQESIDVHQKIDWHIPYLPQLSNASPADTHFVSRPSVLSEILDKLATRLEQLHPVSIFIPSGNDLVSGTNPQPYVEKTATFLENLFGQATSELAQGVWSQKVWDKSHEASIETVYQVHSAVTYTTLSKYLDVLLDYLETMRDELQQDAIALEIDQNLMLV